MVERKSPTVTVTTDLLSVEECSKRILTAVLEQERLWSSSDGVLGVDLKVQDPSVNLPKTHHQR